MFCRSRTTCAACAKRLLTGERKRRAESRIVTNRRKRVAKLAVAVTRKGHRSWHTYSSSSALVNVLKRKFNVVVSSRTVRRDLRALKFKYLVRRKTPTRSAEESTARLNFAKRYLHANPRRIVFSDECWLTCNERTGSGRGEWVRGNDERFPKLNPSVASTSAPSWCGERLGTTSAIWFCFQESKKMEPRGLSTAPDTFVGASRKLPQG